jgi:protease-4
MNYQFLKDAIGSPWHIEAQTLQVFYPVFRGMLSGLQIDKAPEPTNHRRYAVSPLSKDPVPGYYANGGGDDDCEDEQEVTTEQPAVKVIHVMPIRGILTKHDQACGPRGTRTLGQRLAAADKDTNVIGHIIIAESGGGQAVAVAELTDVMATCTKPIWVWIDGMACSAMYYIASYAQGITASRGLDIVGSIGTMAIYEGRKAKSEANEDGEISVTIYADGSEEKNEEYEKAINDFDFTVVKERILNPFNSKFQNDVKIHRPQVLTEQLKGRTYMAQDVVGSLVDEIGNFASVVDKVIEISKFSKQPPVPETQNHLNLKIEMRQFPHLNQVLGVEELAATDEGAFVNEAQFAAIEERLEANQQLVAERDTATQERDTATSTLATAQQTIATAYDPFNAIDPTVAAAATPEAKAEAVRVLLASRPGTGAIQNLGTQDEIITDPEVDWEAINNLPHNKFVDSNS